MLSKLFTTARTLLDRSSQAIGPELRQTESASEPADEMVTTRGQGGPQAIDKSDAEETARREAPSSSRKRQIPSSDSEDSDSNGDEDIGTPASKKQRVLPVRAKDDKEPKTKTRLVEEIPVRRIRMDHTSQIDTVRKESQNEIPATQDVEKVEDSVSHQSRLEIPDSDFENEVSEVGKNVEAPESSGTGQTENKRHTALPSASKAKHKRFDSEESEVMIFSTAVEKEQSEDESSDDEAPEVVGAHEALEQAQMKEREAAKAIEERESALRKKRKERDAILKRQASSKRKREGDIQLHPKRPVPAEISRPNHARDVDDDDDEDDNEAETTKAASTTLKLGPGASLPEFLPEEYLEDNESEDEMALEPLNGAKKVKKMKFTQLIDKNPKDIRKGSTTYRISEVRSTKLAPKSSHNAKSVKESWLQGRAGANRKSFSSGFFKAK